LLDPTASVSDSIFNLPWFSFTIHLLESRFGRLIVRRVRIRVVESCCIVTRYRKCMISTK
jgi:hypothetical protein